MELDAHDSRGSKYIMLTLVKYVSKKVVEKQLDPATPKKYLADLTVGQSDCLDAAM